MVLKPNILFIVNYAWLAIEVIGLSLLLEYIGLDLWISILCWIVFVTVYWLLNFSGQSRLQIGFVLVNVLLTQLCADDIFSSSITMLGMLIFGWSNLKRTEYFLSEMSLVHKNIFKKGEFRLGAIVEFRLIQNPLGRSLNFGVIKVIFKENTKTFYLDGISDPKRCIEELQSKLK